MNASLISTTTKSVEMMLVGHVSGEINQTLIPLAKDG